ncbi:Uncharacterised protein [Mycobacteroides abscessus subsp. abscessus]|nr:Uncharacterised protein [Mycobacteroides abscessus subsp. abscessus]
MGTRLSGCSTGLTVTLVWPSRSLTQPASSGPMPSVRTSPAPVSRPEPLMCTTTSAFGSNRSGSTVTIPQV